MDQLQQQEQSDMNTPRQCNQMYRNNNNNNNKNRFYNNNVSFSPCYLKIITWIFLFLSVSMMIGASGLDSYNTNSSPTTIRTILIISAVFAVVGLGMSIYVNTSSCNTPTECFGSTGLLERKEYY